MFISCKPFTVNLHFIAGGRGDGLQGTNDEQKSYFDLGWGVGGRAKQ